MDFLVFLLLSLRSLLFGSSLQLNSTSPFRNASSRNFWPKKTDRFIMYPQHDSPAEQKASELPNKLQLDMPNYTQYNAAYKYALPYGQPNATGRLSLFDYVYADRRGQYLRQPAYHYAPDQKPIVDACTLPAQIGNGPYRILRWHYSYALKRCELFYWSGCCSNANNFQTQQECQQQCENSDSNSVVYMPFTLTFTMRSGEKSGETDRKIKPTIRIHPAIIDEPIQDNLRNGEITQVNVDELDFRGPIKPSSNEARRHQAGSGDEFRHPQATQTRIAFPEYRLSSKWENNSEWNSVIHELAAGSEELQPPSFEREPLRSPFKSPFQTTTKSSESDAGFRRMLPIQQMVTAVAVPPPPPPLPTAQVLIPAPQTLIPVYPVAASTANLVSIQSPLTPTQAIVTRTSYEDGINPCAYGASATLVHCAVPSTTCTGEQFCHVGPSRDATVCCEKPTILDPCSQPLNIGVGGANLRRFFYDPARQQCESYIYRGYQGNENNFLTMEDCQSVCQVNPCARGEPFRSTMGVLYCSAMSVCPGGYYCHLGADTRTSVCCPVLGSDPCSQPLENGFGEAPTAGGLIRWYFDATQQQCLSFIYAGQKGTQNNFLSREDCEGFCQTEDPCKLPAQHPLTPCIPGPGECGGRPDLWCHVGATRNTTVCCPAETLHHCLQPAESGTGNMPSERWHFDARVSRCAQFVYNGLKGNQNNFMSRVECEANCFPNPCAIGKPLITVDSRLQTCSASTAISTCPMDHWCHVGPDASTTVCCPNANPNPCRLPMSSGDGMANLERFYYDQSSKSCRSFQYRGLKGNQNNFLTMKACQLTCQPLDNPCVGQSAKGPAGQPLFCSAVNRESCPVNFWCHLGASPETTICCPGATNPCSVPLAPGTGNAGLARWYYNTDDRACVAFQYNGKRGNQNNFLTHAECQRTCPEQLCMLSIDRGACSGRQTRYAYDRQIGQCVPFEYTGCGGNLNNFLTMADCVATCGDVSF